MIDNTGRNRKVWNVVSIILIMLSLWAIDISTTAMMNNLILYNGIYTMNPATAYHVGVGVIILCTLITGIMNAKVVLQW